jgi:uncharacterized membrane protein YbhN (UPF0104 family)
MKAVWSTITSAAAVIGDANLAFVVAAFAVDTVALVLMAFRWRVLLRSLGSGAGLWQTLLAYSGGVCVCNITPARTVGGDACRAALIRQPGEPPPMKTIAVSVFYDRATDAAGLLMLGVLALPVIRPSSPRWIAVALFLLTLAAALAVRPLYRGAVARFAAWHQAALGRVTPGAIALAIGCSLLIWLLDITRVMLVGTALQVTIAPSQAAAMSLLRLGSGVVPVPAGIGVVDGALVGGFMWLGLPPSTAAAMTMVERAIVFGWGTALGALSLLLLGGARAWKRARGQSPPRGAGEAGTVSEVDG